MPVCLPPPCLLLTHSSLQLQLYPKQNCCRKTAIASWHKFCRGLHAPNSCSKVLATCEFTPICQSLCLMHLMKKFLRDGSVNFKSPFPLSLLALRLTDVLFRLFSYRVSWLICGTNQMYAIKRPPIPHLRDDFRC